MPSRVTFSGITGAQGGCFECMKGTDAKWFSKNALALAAKHHDKTGHKTWAEQVISVRYGK